MQRPASSSSAARRSTAGRIDTGPIAGQNVATVNAAAWHAAGVLGSVKVGVVDFFDLGLWPVEEAGPVPDAQHRFCRDTSGRDPGYCPIATDGTRLGKGEEHGVAVAEAIKDIAPGAELYLATAATVADLRAAIDWFAANGVTIVSRSLGSAYDGPGDGTGPLAAVVDHAASLGIAWFNSAGNDGIAAYGRYSAGVTASGYVDFDPGPGVDITLGIDPETSIDGRGCVGFDGIRWNDWNKPAHQVADYRIEVLSGADPTPRFFDASQRRGAPPLEMADVQICDDAPLQVRIRRIADGGDRAPDVIEVALHQGRIEDGRWQAEGSAGKPVVDSANPALVAVGAIEPAGSSNVAPYSSRGPTNDGRVKPDVTAPSCVASSIYSPANFGPGACFNGTSAAAPTVAGVAALLSDRGLAERGTPLAALVRHLVTDRGIAGPDNAYGTGQVMLPPPPPAGVDSRAARIDVLEVPQRILDTRSDPAPGKGGQPVSGLIDVTVPPGPRPITAVAVTITSVDSLRAGYIQALPTLTGRIGAFANLNVAVAGQVKPNFAIVPVGDGGRFTLYMPTGGHVVVDLMATFSPVGGEAPSPITAGRYVPLTATRILDTRPASGGPTPPGWVAHRPAAGELLRLGGFPADAGAVVINLTATEAAGSGFLRAQATGVPGVVTANGNYVAGTDSGTLAVVPIGADGTITIGTSNSAHLVGDLVGYVTGPGAAASIEGLFVPIVPERRFDSRSDAAGVLSAGSTRTAPLGGGSVAAGATAVALNLAADAALQPGFATLHPGGSPPLVSNLNFPAAVPISNGALPRLSASGTVDVFVNRTTHVIIDVNGYFTGPS